jgi:hypothetical protein
MDAALWVVLGGTAAAVWASWLYFGRWRIARPPIGVFGGGDVAAMLVGIVLVPYLYLALPAWLVVALLGLGLGGVLYPLIEAVRPSSRLVWPAVTLVLGADVSAWAVFGAGSAPFLAANGVVVVAAVVGVTNLWAQAAMRPAHAAGLAAGLTLYDAAATWGLGQMAELYGRLGALPFAPLLAWPAQPGRWLGIGLGDLLLAAVVPLVFRRVYGHGAGMLALTAGLATLAMLVVLSHVGATGVTFPAVVVLGPLIVAQYLGWRAGGRTDRSVWQWRLAESP